MLIFLDIETTGFDGEKDALLEIAAIAWDGEKQCKRFSCLVRQAPLFSIPAMITSLTGITDQMCEDQGISLALALEQLDAFVSPDDIIVGHNISFDIGFLQKKGLELPQKSIDTFLLSILLLGKNESSHSLEILAKKYGIRQDDAHRAMSDTEANLELYIFLQSYWKKNKSFALVRLLQEKKEALDCTEQLFFLEDPKIDFVPSAIPQNTEVPMLDLSVSESFLYEDWITTPNAVWMQEVSFAESCLVPMITAAQKHNLPLCIAYPDEETELTLELRDVLIRLFPNISSRFIGPVQYQIDELLWEKFLQKSSYTRAESIVLLKIFCAKEQNTQEYLRFLGEEWIVARSLFTRSFIPQEYSEDLLFIPFSQTYFVPDPYKMVVLRGENLESMLEEKEKIKVFEKRFHEDLPLFDCSAFDTIAKTLRAWKGENKYTIPVFEHEYMHDSSIQAALRSIENQCRNDETFATAEWKTFFDIFADKTHVFCIDLYPDNSLAFSLTPKYLQESFDELIACGNGVMILGRAFTKNKEKKLHYTFLIDEAVQCIPNTTPFPPFSFEVSWETISQALLDKKTVVVSVSSKKAADDIVETMRSFCEANNVFIAAQRGGSVKKIRTQMKEYKSIIVVGIPSFLDALRLDTHPVSILYIPKLSFDPQNHTILKYRREVFRNDFEDFAMPRATQRLHKEIRRFPNASLVIIGDEKIKQPWAKSMLSL